MNDIMPSRVLTRQLKHEYTGPQSRNLDFGMKRVR